MVSSIDGRATAEGKTKLLGSEIDRTLFLQLRTQVDAVLAGTRTVEIEHYGRLVRRPEMAEIRHRLGLQPEPLAVLVTRSMRLPLDAPIFHDPDSRIVVFTSSDRDIEELPASVELVRCSNDKLSLTSIFKKLRSEYGVQTLLVEGGPTLNSAVFSEGLADELFLTLSPKLVGGRDPMTIIAGEIGSDIVELGLVSVLTKAGFLFLRYRITAKAAR